MPFWDRKRTVSIDAFCGEFYDEEVFGSPAAGDGQSRKAWWEDALDVVTDIDPSTSRVDRSLFQREVNALRLELFAVAWLDEFERAQPVIPQGDVTKRYLAEKNASDIWAIMGAYNAALARAATLRDDGQSIDEAKRDVQEKSRSELLARWSRKGFDPESLQRVANRLGAHFEPSSSALKLLAVTFLGRLGIGENPGADTVVRTSALIFGWYKDIRQALGRISLREDVSFRWF